ncbi:tetratricopeptide repeat protein [Stagnimonas aquatica]|nr:adenylate/guanylate cyclase domain-containing protein [Stagnimonas aquatica]
MFTDVVAYSAMMRADEAGTLRRLSEHYRLLRRVLRQHGGREVKTIGDGMLICFPSALAAFQCALAVQRAQAEHNHRAAETDQFQIRIGIHLGDVEMRDSDLMGDGVNVAARVQTLAPSGGIAVTAAVRAQVHSALRSVLQPAGAQLLKNIPEPIEVFLVEPADAAKSLEHQADHPASAWQPKLLLAGAAVVLLIGLVSLAVLLRPQSTATPSPNPVIAVLPFESLSDDAQNGYFAAGMQDEVLSRLAGIHSLRVMTRLFDEAPAAPDTKLSVLLRRLKISHLLEGSVQKSGATVRIRLRLSDVARGEQIWAQQFDRKLDDVLAVQSEIAAAVVSALRLNLSAAEAQRLSRRPTKVPRAYDDYLRGLALITRPSPTTEDRQRAAQHFSSAVQHDPQFAAAWAWWSRSLSLRYIYGEDASEAARQSAREAADKARSLDPELMQAQFAEAYFQYWVEQRYAAAYASFEQLRQRYPNDAEPAYALALIARRLGRWQDSLKHFEASLALDPVNAPALAEWGLTLMGLRRFDAALTTFDRALELSPADAQLLGRKASAYLALGRLPEAEALLKGLPLEAWDYVGAAQFTLWQYQRRTDAIIAAQQGFLQALDPGADFDRGLYLAFLGWVQRSAGQQAPAERSFRQARSALTSVVETQPDNYAAWSSLASAEAGLGDLEATERAGQRAIKILNAMDDAYWSPVMEEFLARAEAGLGRADLAVPRLRRLLNTAYGEWPLTETDLRLSPDWDPIRTDPSFQALLTSS